MARTIADIEAELVKVRKAIEATYGGAEFEIESGGARRRLKRTDLTKLTDREASLVRELSRMSADGAAGGGVRVGVAVN